MAHENTIVRKPFVHISRRSDVTKKTTVIVKIVSILGALILCGLISTIVAPGSFLDFYVYLYEGTMYSTNTILATLWNAGLLLLIAAAITPAFKMKFWNIGAEGQVLMGALGAAIIMKFVAPSMPNIVALLLMFVVAALFSMVWSFIPAFFKAMFNTNETLFSLMMNYVAIGIVASFSLRYKAPTGTAIGIINRETRIGWLPEIGGYKYIINIIIIIILVVIIWGYLKFSKHGYEISVINGSERTAEYVGINVKVVTIRTMLVCGLVCGIAGFLIVSGASHTVSDSIVGGRGFTAVMISWLGHFNPLEMMLYAVLNSFISTGSSHAAGNLGYSGEVGKVLSGLFFLAILTSEFFINFQVKFNVFTKKKKLEDADLQGGK